MGKDNHNEENPWQTLSTNVVYENNWISVEHNEVNNPVGNKGIYGTVHFKNLAVGVVVLDADLNTFIVGQYRYPLKAYSWEIPEGGSPLNLNPLESAKRELKEETGIIANKWTKLFEMHLSNSVSDEKAIIYLAQDLEHAEAEPEESEALQLRKLPFQELLDLVLEGKVTDSMSVAAVLWVDKLIIQGKI